MSLSLYSPPTFALLTLTLTFLFYASFSPPVCAQGFRPAPDFYKCNAFVEGQGLYLLGGSKAKKNFMLDLSVSWNTSDPVFKKIEGGPRVRTIACAMTNNGEDLFVLTAGTGYVYNVKSSSWTVFQNVNFTSGWPMAVADPETGFIYLPSGGEDFAGREVMLSVDLKTGKVNTTDLYRIGGGSLYLASTSAFIIWSELLRSFLILSFMQPALVFTPSKATDSTNGWSTLVIGQYPNNFGFFDCGAPAYGGPKIVFIASDFGMKKTHLYIFDVTERT